MLRKSTKDIIVILLMKMLSKIVDSQFGILSPQNFVEVNGTCHLKDDWALCFDSADTTTSWIYSTRYLLAVLGGLLADACVGYLVVLHICGHLMLLSSVMLAVAIFFNFICRSPSFITAAWSLVPFVYGLIQPCVIYCVYRWHSQPRVWTVLNAAYYLSMKVGELIGILLPMSRTLLEKYYILVGIIVSIGFIVLSRWLKSENRRQGPVVFPTKARLIRYFKIFSPMILFAISIINSRAMVYTIEMRHYMGLGVANATSELFQRSFISPELVKVNCQIVWCLLLLLVAYRSPKHLSMELRLQGGILLKALVEIGLLVVSLSPPRQSLFVRAVFWAASAVDGAAELLTVIAALELLNGIAPSSCKLSVLGIGFTVWGLSNFSGRSLVAILSTVPLNNPVLQPAPDQAPLFYIYHLIMLVLLFLSSTYYRIVAYPMALNLFLNGELHEDVDADEVLEPEMSNEGSPLMNYGS